MEPSIGTITNPKDSYRLIAFPYISLSIFWGVFGTFLFVKQRRSISLKNSIFIAIFFLTALVLSFLANYFPKYYYPSVIYLTAKTSLILMIFCATPAERTTLHLATKFALIMTFLLVVFISGSQFLFDGDIIVLAKSWDKVVSILDTIVELILLACTVIRYKEAHSKLNTFLLIMLAVGFTKEVSTTLGVLTEETGKALTISHKIAGWIYDVLYTAATICYFYGA